MRIDFYLIEGAQQQQLLFACRLADKVYRQGERLAVLVENQAAADQLDQLMWTYQVESFLPHAQHPTTLDVPIIIGQNTKDLTQVNILLNLTNMTVNLNNYRLLEVLSSETEVLSAGRIRYKSYQQQGHQLKMHDLRKKLKGSQQ